MNLCSNPKLVSMGKALLGVPGPLSCPQPPLEGLEPSAGLGTPPQGPDAAGRTMSSCVSYCVDFLSYSEFFSHTWLKDYEEKDGKWVLFPF